MATPSAHDTVHHAVPPGPDGTSGRPRRHCLRPWITQGFGRPEDVVYAGLGLLWAVNPLAVLLLVASTFARACEPVPRHGTLGRSSIACS
jgi:hypothetical protein